MSVDARPLQLTMPPHTCLALTAKMHMAGLRIERLAALPRGLHPGGILSALEASQDCQRGGRNQLIERSDGMERKLA